MVSTRMSQKTKKDTFWDEITKTDTEKKLLARLRRMRVGQMCERRYNGYEWKSDDPSENTFVGEILYHVGYEIGLWYQDLEEYASKSRYPDDITPNQIKSAKQWVYDAEKLLGTGRQVYFGGDF